MGRVLGRRCRTLPPPASLATFRGSLAGTKADSREPLRGTWSIKKPSRLIGTGRVVSSNTEREGLTSGPFGILGRLGGRHRGISQTSWPLGSNRGSHPRPPSRITKPPRSCDLRGFGLSYGARGIELRRFASSLVSGFSLRVHPKPKAPRLEPGFSPSPTL